ncbi:benenodin family lasso peptide [Luteimonas terricola]|nr:benenodin family lasso peptide [Luteimonas terricola]
MDTTRDHVPSIDTADEQVILLGVASVETKGQPGMGEVVGEHAPSGISQE